jgi:transposase InsO family protein
VVKQAVLEKVPVSIACKALEVSRSGYYNWLNPKFSKQKNDNIILLDKIKKIHQESRKTYGSPRIHASLKQLGYCCGKNRVVNLMKTAGITGLIRKRYKISTTDSKHDFPIAERFFKTEDIITHPTNLNQVWVSDISYIPTEEGFLFLATYLDLFTRKIVGFTIDDHMRTELLLDGLNMSLGRQQVNRGGLTIHSDRGSQYASEAYRSRLKLLGITASMSRKANCYDNAFAESFFATLKKDLVYRRKFKTKDEAKKLIFEYIEVWYNRKRLHSSIGFMTPVQFEESLAA